MEGQHPDVVHRPDAEAHRGGARQPATSSGERRGRPSSARPDRARRTRRRWRSRPIAQPAGSCKNRSSAQHSFPPAAQDGPTGLSGTWFSLHAGNGSPELFRSGPEICGFTIRRGSKTRCTQTHSIALLGRPEGGPWCDAAIAASDASHRVAPGDSRCPGKTCGTLLSCRDASGAADRCARLVAHRVRLRRFAGAQPWRRRGLRTDPRPAVLATGVGPAGRLTWRSSTTCVSSSTSTTRGPSSRVPRAQRQRGARATRVPHRCRRCPPDNTRWNWRPISWLDPCSRAPGLHRSRSRSARPPAQPRSPHRKLRQVRRCPCAPRARRPGSSRRRMAYACRSTWSRPRRWPQPLRFPTTARSSSGTARDGFEWSGIGR